VSDTAEGNTIPFERVRLCMKDLRTDDFVRLWLASVSGPGIACTLAIMGGVMSQRIMIVKSEYCPMPKTAKMTTSTRLF
jgi:hypothetical protein